MATSDPASRTTETEPDQADSGLGLAHLTVVPTNLDPEASERRQE